MDYSEEARLAVEEVRYALNEGWISERLENTSLRAHLNITTREGEEFCVRLSSIGFQVVGRAHDKVSGESEKEEEERAWETIYSLLEHISPSYSTSFSQRLANQLSRLHQSADDEGEKTT